MKLPTFYMRSTSSAKVISNVPARIAGIEKISTKNIDALDGLLSLQEDSQIEFNLKKFLIKNSFLTYFRVEVISLEIELTPKLYLDYGGEYNEITAILMAPDGENAWACYIPTPYLLKRVRLDLAEAPATVNLKAMVAQRASLAQLVSGIFAIEHHRRSRLALNKVGFGVDLLGRCAERIAHGNEQVNHALASEVFAAALNHVPAKEHHIDDEYQAWIKAYETLSNGDLEWMTQKTREFSKTVTFSILMPVYSPPLDLLSEAIESLRNQTYPHWELCIADDASDDEEVRILIKDYAERDSRITFTLRKDNGHISRATNSAAELASGEFIVLMDNDDLLPPHALFTAAYYIDANPGCRMLFSDEDKISLGGFRCDPYRKGSFDRFLMYGHNMFSHLGIFARDLFESVNGFRVGYEGSQDYDLTLRCMEHCADAQIVHIPHVLYHWRQIPGSTSLAPGEKSYAFKASKRAINDHFERQGYLLQSVDAEVPGVAAVRTLMQPHPASISVVIPTKDGLDLLRPCIDSLMSYPDILTNVVIVDNGSQKTETLEYLESLVRDSSRFSVVRDDGSFNFSRIVNLGVTHARGEIVCLMNNDTELLSGKLYERARAWLAMPDVGIVGARLLYPDFTIQHFGVYVGVGDQQVADHVHVGLPDHSHAEFSKSRLLQQFSAVTAACLFVRKADYLAVGGFNEELAVAYNDVDFCLRIRGRGLKIVCDPEIKLIHKESRSRGLDNHPVKAARLAKEAAIVRERWGSSLNDPFYNPNFARDNPRFEISLKARLPIPWKLNFGRDVFKKGLSQI